MALTVGLLGGFIVAAFAVLSTALTVSGAGQLVPAQDLPVLTPPECGSSTATILTAQAMPSATKVPCIAALPSGWSFDNAQIHSGEAKVWLNSDRAGPRAVEIQLVAACPAPGGIQVTSDEVGTRRFERPTSLSPELSGDRFYVFEGGCVRYRYEFAPGTHSSLLFDMDAALSFESRADLVAYVEEHEDQVLCGAGARCAS